MPNHIHLIIEVNKYSLAQIMQNIAYRYSRWLNHRLNRIGHLFQGRYKAILIQNESYMLELCRYIHLNPLRAKLVDFSKNYQWSSHRAYLEIEQVPWLTTDTILSFLSMRLENADMSYKAFIQQNNNYEFIPYLATDSIGNLIINDSIINNTNQALKIKSRKDLELNFIIETVCAELDINKVNISSSVRCKKLFTARTLITFFALEYTQNKIITLAHILKRSPQRISNAANDLKRTLLHDSNPPSEIMRINNKLQAAQQHKR